MMTNDKLIRFVKRWRELERQQKDLDFARSQLARDMRAEFPAGSAGDHQFTKWCETEFGVTAFGARELILRAAAATVVPDERTWKMIGGFRCIRSLQDVSRKDQIAVIEAAKSSGKAIRTVMRDRGLCEPANPIVHTSPRESIARVHADAVALAEYIRKTAAAGLPRDIMKIINRYAAAQTAAKKAA